MKKIYQLGFTIGLGAIVSLLFSSLAAATPILGQGLPTDDSNLVGGTVIDFESTGPVNVPSLSISGVTFTGNANIEVDSDYAGSYNTRGEFHITNHGNDPVQFRFDFDAPVDAFAFLWGAADTNWTLSAYSGSTLLETLIVAPTHASNAGDYFGIANSGITFATLNISSGFDYVFIDNFTFQDSASVPEPATMLLFGTGLAGFAGLRMKKKKK